MRTFEDRIYVKDLKIPAGIEVFNLADESVASVTAPAEEEVAAPVEATTELPEVIGKKKDEEGAGAEEAKK